ncbi:MAG: phage major capsid protein, partial [Planctomycetota bacterium]
MRQRLVKLINEKKEAVTDMESMLALADSEDRDFTPEEQTDFDNLKERALGLQKSIDNENALINAQADMPQVPDVNRETRLETFNREGANSQQRTSQIITFPYRRGTLRCFTGEDGEMRAYRFGQFIRGCAKIPSAIEWCRQNGIALHWEDGSKGAVYQEGVDTQGGYLVLPEFDRDIIRLVNEYGLARRRCRISPMGSDVKSRDRRTGGLTAYFVGENQSGTEVTGSWDQVKLIAKDIMILTRISNQLNADSMIDMADNIAVEAAYAFAKLEDDCLLIGDGSSTYGGIVGINQKLVDINGVDEGGGLILAAGNVMSEVIMGDFDRMIAILPAYAEKRAVWTCSKYFYGAVMGRLLNALGGNTIDLLQRGPTGRQFLGYPVDISESMPKTDGNSQVNCLLGDTYLSTDFGDRVQMMIALSDSASVGGESVFERNQLALRV